MNCPHCGKSIDAVGGQAADDSVVTSVHHTGRTVLPAWMPAETWQGYLEINCY